MAASLRVPAFLKGVTNTDPAPSHANQKPGVRIRPVAWATAPDEPAGELPLRPLTDAPSATAPLFEVPLSAAAPPVLTASQLASETTPPSGFEALTSAPSSAAPVAPGTSAAAAAQRQMDERSSRLGAAIAALRAQGERLAEQARADALEIGMMVARRILEREISTNVDSLFSMIKSAIRRAGESRALVVRLSPGDCARVQDSGESAFSLGRVQLVADETLSVGDVVVATDHSSIDGRLGTRLTEVRRELAQTLKED
jgi:flagellar assembly protein FliH